MVSLLYYSLYLLYIAVSKLTGGILHIYLVLLLIMLVILGFV